MGCDSHTEAAEKYAGKQEEYVKLKEIKTEKQSAGRCPKNSVPLSSQEATTAKE